MLNFIVRRSLYSLLVICGVMFFTFVLFNLAAGDPAAAALGKNARPREIEAFRRELGADLPMFFGRFCRTEAFRPAGEGVYRREFPASEVCAVVTCADGSRREERVSAAAELFRVPAGAKAEFYRVQKNPFNSQFFRSFGEVVRFRSAFPYVECFNFGRTLTTREPIRELLWRGVWPSLALMVPVFCGELLLGIVLALVATAFRDRWPDRLLVVLAVSFMSVSYLVLIIGAQWFFGYRLGWFPLWGFEGPRHLWLPVLTGILFGVGGNIRF
ncbi:MAG: hypothetical protein IJJ28_02210, partial [Lentisphaeria bacterium]|nr:hypothetical protein [Lentisphaeria bacterium]